MQGCFLFLGFHRHGMMSRLLDQRELAGLYQAACL